MVSALNSGARGLNSRPGQVKVLCSWAKNFILTVPLSLSTQEYKMGPGELSWKPDGMLEVNLHSMD